MKILHVTPSFYPALIYGGPTYSVYALCRSLVGRQCQVRVLTTDANGPNSVLSVNTTQDVEVSPRLVVRYCHRIADVSVSPTLLRLLAGYISWADVIHLTSVYSFPTIPALFACKLLGKPVVWSPRGMLQQWEGRKRPLLKCLWDPVCNIAAPKRMVLHVTSEQEARESQSRLPGVEMIVIPNGVDVPQGVSHRNGEDRWRFAYLGRLDPKKGIENLLDAYEIVGGALDRASSLVIAGDGDGPYTGQIYSQIDKRGLDGTVQMIGHVSGDAKREFFETIDTLVIPSHTENFGMVVAEALAHGVPVIASRGTPWSRVEEVGCGLWVDNDPRNLAAAMGRITSMPVREMGCKGREWMQREFSWDFVAERMIGVYRDLVSAAE